MHAVGESIQVEHPPGTNAIVLQVSTEHELRQIAKKLSLTGVKHTLIQEVDPPYAGQCTAIGIVPLYDRSLIKPILSKLPLLRSVQERVILPVVQSQDGAPRTDSSEAEHPE